MFKFNNISSEALNVVCEEETNLLKKASIITNTDITSENVDLDYSIVGYNVVDGTIKIFITNPSVLDDVMSWLNGKGILEYKGRVTKAAFFDELDLIRSATIYTASVNFTRSPFWYKKDDDYIEVSDIVTNEGDVYTYPIIYLEKNTSDSIELSINDVRFSYKFPEGENYVEIDCNKAEAKYDNLLRNLYLTISFEFPILKPGINSINVHSGDATIKIKRKDCWL